MVMVFAFVVSVLIQSSCMGPLDCNARECLECACVNAKCVCKDGWSGNNCELPFCTNRTQCSNHGNCQQAAYDITCICDSGYSGARCKLNLAR
jgi:hypothetical protein